jgi:hypothetical protein
MHTVLREVQGPTGDALRNAALVLFPAVCFFAVAYAKTLSDNEPGSLCQSWADSYKKFIAENRARPTKFKQLLTDANTKSVKVYCSFSPGLDAVTRCHHLVVDFSRGHNYVIGEIAKLQATHFRSIISNAVADLEEDVKVCILEFLPSALFFSMLLTCGILLTSIFMIMTSN